MSVLIRVIALLWIGILPLAARAADINDPFEEFFAQHQRAGSLLSVRALHQVEQQGWGPQFRQALLTRFHGQPLNGLEVAVSPAPNTAPRANQSAALEFTVTNHSPRAVELVTGGNCHTVHGAVFTAIYPDGRLYWNQGGIPGGGGHCFCTQTKSTLAAGSSVKLDHRTDRNVISWKPPQPGRYYVVGEYHTAGGVAYSAPVPFDVQ